MQCAVCMVVECWEVGGVLVVSSHFSVVLLHRGLCQGEREPGGWRVATTTTTTTIYNNHHAPDQQLPGTSHQPFQPFQPFHHSHSCHHYHDPTNLKSGLQEKSAPTWLTGLILRANCSLLRKYLIKRETFQSESCEEEAVRRRKEINWLLLTPLLLSGTGFTTIGNRFIIFVVAETCTLQSKFFSSNTSAVETLSWKWNRTNNTNRENIKYEKVKHAQLVVSRIFQFVLHFAKKKQKDHKTTLKCHY